MKSLADALPQMKKGLHEEMNLWNIFGKEYFNDWIPQYPT